MHKRISLLLILAAVSAAAAASAAPAESDDVPNIIVKLADDAHSEGSFEVQSADAAGDLGKPIGQRTNLRRVPRNPDETLEQQLQRVSAMKGVLYAVPDHRVTPAAVRPASGEAADTDAVAQKLPDGPSRQEWARQWGLQRIGMERAWNVAVGAKNVNRAVTVCVIDSGVDMNHPGLVWNLGGGFNAVNGEDQLDYSDVLGHGTTIAGVIAGTGADGGPVGINWRNLNLLACKFMSPEGYGKTSDAVECIDYCLGQGASIISASWTTGTIENPPLEDAVAATQAAGALLVVAAGNYGTDMGSTPYYPQVYSKQYSNVMVVAASDEFDEHPSFSNFDPASVHIHAPGVGIYTTVPGGSYSFTAGTSIAAPLVTGAAALLQAVAQDRQGVTLTAQQLKQQLMDSAEPLSALRGRTATGGRLRVDWALQMLLNRPLSKVTPCQAPPSKKARKCAGGKGGGIVPRRRRALREGGAAAAAAAEADAADMQMGPATLARTQALPAHARQTRSAGMQRELLRQREQQRLHAAAAEVAGRQKGGRRLQAADSLPPY